MSAAPVGSRTDLLSDFEVRSVAAAWEAVRLARDLLERTRPLVAPTVGGSWIGSRPDEAADPASRDDSGQT